MTTGQRKQRSGVVFSNKMDKTVVVLVERLVKHPKYKKYLKVRKKFKAHDERNEARVGDTVRIEESRPLSATKRWRLVEIVERAGEGASDQIVSEEAATTEAIHMAAHPGRHEAAEEASA